MTIISKTKNNLINDENEASKEFVTEGLADSTQIYTKSVEKSDSKVAKFNSVNSPGMRIIKTAIAILICLLVSYMFDINTAMQSSIAAIVCLGQDIRNTWRVSKNRLIGTLIAGVYAYLFILFSLVLEMTPLTIGYLIMTGIFVIPLMSFLCASKNRRSGYCSDCLYYYCPQCGRTSEDPCCMLPFVYYTPC